jgi:hypothetical protein
MNLTQNFVRVATLVAAVCVWSSLANAQVGEPKSDKAPGYVTVTGCLQKGALAEEFTITGEDGKAYNLHSTAVKLAGHVGHKVTITGMLTREKETGSKDVGLSLNVLKLAMVSTSCS